MLRACMIVGTLALAACKGSDAAKSDISDLHGCARYAAMEARCTGAREESIHAMCDASQEASGSAVGAGIGKEVDCAQTTTDCGTYRACVLKANEAR